MISQSHVTHTVFDSIRQVWYTKDKVKSNNFAFSLPKYLQQKVKLRHTIYKHLETMALFHNIYLASLNNNSYLPKIIIYLSNSIAK